MKSLPLIFLVTILSALFGCSSINQALTPSSTETSNAQETSVAFGRTSDSFTAPIGVFRGYIDPKTLTAELIPSRNASKIGDIFDADITKFLLYTPCWNCVRIDNVMLTPDLNFAIKFAIKHPVSNIAVRPDLHAFDVHGIMIIPGDDAFGIQYPLPNNAGTAEVSGNASSMLNPDGYTTHFDEIPEDPHYFDPPIPIAGNLNPFKRFFTNPDTPAFDPHSPQGYNVFPVGSGWESQEYILKVPLNEPVEFVFVVDASYGHSAVLANRQNPQYYLPSFNRKEAWKVDVITTENKLVAKDDTSTASFRIDVYDWQGGRTIDPNYPDPTHLGGIPYTSNVNGITISAPDLAPPLDVATPTSGTGAWGDPYKFDATITNTLKANVGTYAGLVCVKDELRGQDGPIAIPPSPSGFPFEGPNIMDYAAYQMFDVVIADPWDIKPDPFPGDYQVYFGSAMATGDFNNDSIDDIAIAAPGADPSGTILVYFGNGHTLIEPPVALNTDAAGFSKLGTKIEVAKMDLDEFDDIVATTYDGGVAIFLSNGTGGFQAPILKYDGAGMNDYYGTELALGKMNNDDYSDIVTSAYGANVGPVIRAGKVYVYLFDGTTIQNRIEITQAVPASSGTFGFKVNVADFNSDNYDDILANYSGEIYPGEYEDVEIDINNWSGGVAQRKYLRTLLPTLNTPTIGSSIATIDLNNDSIKEWIIGAEMNSLGSFTAAGEFFIFYPNGNMGFRGYQRYQNGSPESSDRLCNVRSSAGDINGDGGLDLIISTNAGGINYDGEVQIFISVPGGYTFYKEITEIEGATFFQAFGCATACMDVDGNGDDELIIGSASGGSWEGHAYVYFNP